MLCSRSGSRSSSACSAAPAEAAEEQTDLMNTTAIGEKKINVIKAVRELTTLGLKEAKALVDEAPNPVKENLKEEAEKLRPSSKKREPV